MTASQNNQQRIFGIILLVMAITGSIMLPIALALSAQPAELLLNLIGLSSSWTLYILYRRGWPNTRYLAISFFTLMIAFGLPEPFVSREFSVGIFIAPALATLIGDRRTIGLSVLTIYFTLLIRAGWQGIYLEPTGMAITGLITCCLYLTRTITDKALEDAQKHACDLEHERAKLAQRIQAATSELSLANTELVRANTLKGAFLAGMSHELRTPLNVILGNAELLEDGVYGEMSDRQFQAVSQITRSGRHLLSLIDDILDFSRIDAGTLELQPELINAMALSEACIQTITPEARQKGLQVSFIPDPSIHLLWVDPRRLRQCLLALLSNAIKFTSKGAVGLKVSSDSVSNTVRFTVWDTGIGIAPEAQKRIFQPFVQLDNSFSRQYEGAGLGLALVEQITALQGGMISVKSELGQGSEFTITLPWITTPPERLA